MDAVTTLSDPAFEVARLKDMATVTPSSNEGFTFIKLPTEIRLLIYKELLVRNGRPELSSCLDDHHRSFNHTLNFFVHPAILRTCKAIYHEALPMLYGKNIFELLCAFGQLGKQHFWYRTLGPSPLLTCPNPHASAYIKQVFLTYIGIGLKRLDIIRFLECWPKIEREVLQLYPSIESIFLQFRQPTLNTICLKLVRRHRNKREKGRRIQNHKAVFDNFDEQQTRDGKASSPGEDIWHILEDLGTAIVHNETRGYAHNTIFAVQAIRWRIGPSLHLRWEQFDRYEIYLGCELT